MRESASECERLRTLRVELPAEGELERVINSILTRLHARLLRPCFAALEPENPSSIPHPLRAALHRVDQEIQHMLENARLLAKAA